MVRAKFVVSSIERTEQMAYSDGKPTGAVQVSTIMLHAVVGASGKSGKSENTAFWRATPSGELRLGTISATAAEYFELGKEYYLDLTKAD